jgi:Bacterial regulatory proteins, tetR family
VNDVISVGANPLVVTAYFAADDAAWYGNQQRSLDPLRGWRAACEEAGAAWGEGESPALPGTVMPDAIELAGSALGLVPVGRDLVLGADVAVGDKIVLLASSGLHANGATLARRVAAELPDGWLTELRRPRTFSSEDTLTAAVAVFAEKGYEHTSLSDLTEAMGISPTSMYLAFGSKEDLFPACHEGVPGAGGRAPDRMLARTLGARRTRDPAAHRSRDGDRSGQCRRVLHHPAAAYPRQRLRVDHRRRRSVPCLLVAQTQGPL